jgi:hypothetical protein
MTARRTVVSLNPPFRRLQAEPLVQGLIVYVYAAFNTAGEFFTSPPARYASRGKEAEPIASDRLLCARRCRAWRNIVWHPNEGSAFLKVKDRSRPARSSERCERRSPLTRTMSRENLRGPRIHREFHKLGIHVWQTSMGKCMARLRKYRSQKRRTASESHRRVNRAANAGGLFLTKLHAACCVIAGAFQATHTRHRKEPGPPLQSGTHRTESAVSIRCGQSLTSGFIRSSGWAGVSLALEQSDNFIDITDEASNENIAAISTIQIRCLFSAKFDDQHRPERHALHTMIFRQ